MPISFEILKEEFDRTWWKERKRGKGREGKGEKRRDMKGRKVAAVGGVF